MKRYGEKEIGGKVRGVRGRRRRGEGKRDRKREMETVGEVKKR